MNLNRKFQRIAGFISIIGLLSPFVIFAQGGNPRVIPQTPNNIQEITSAYRKYKDIAGFAITAPTVVEIPFNEAVERFEFAVLDTATNSFQPAFLKQDVNLIPVRAEASNTPESPMNMLDQNTRTYTDFPLPEEARGETRILLTTEQSITSSSLALVLDNFVALPTEIEIRAVVNGADRIVVARTKMSGGIVRFPATTAARWIITLEYAQPLRIAELRLAQNETIKVHTRSLRFLAQPDHSYRLYFDPDRFVIPRVGESGNLTDDREVMKLLSPRTQVNPTYIPADVDRDGLEDAIDNCVNTPNPDQIDINGNRRGDDCDDFDRDGIINSKDNCPAAPNRYQEDEDGDGIGNVCDTEESRVTERYGWLPWLGVGFAAVVLISLFILTARSTKSPPDSPVSPVS